MPDADWLRANALELALTLMSLPLALLREFLESALDARTAGFLPVLPALAALPRDTPCAAAVLEVARFLPRAADEPAFELP